MTQEIKHLLETIETLLQAVTFHGYPHDAYLDRAIADTDMAIARVKEALLPGES